MPSNESAALRRDPLHLARQSARWERIRSAHFERQPSGALRAQQHRLHAEEFDRQAEQLLAKENPPESAGGESVNSNPQ